MKTECNPPVFVDSQIPVLGKDAKNSDLENLVIDLTEEVERTRVQFETLRLWVEINC